ncbi:hypothetical protein QJS10_CPB11g01199 [Acorus calamus]|uniref:Uncharacterized protein n=1 Tax=Acorus calamus TaxID=4465 RepID=A0AAV9DQW6_ACOCL|nr:hypothetical protein QJS10_CPB11g01199 [Acorus calamus]
MKHPRNTKIDDNHPRRLLHRLLCCGPSPAPLRILLAATTDAPPCGHHRLLRPLSNLAHHHLLRPPPCDPNSCTSDPEVCDSQSGQHVRGLDVELLVIVELVECNGLFIL